MNPSALNGVRVIDLTRVIAGPHCTMILGDLGADVIKIEKPGEGDISRGYAPYFQGESTYFMTHNRNKKSISLNYRHPKSKEILHALIKGADVLVENFKAGTLEKMGLAPDTLLEWNPGLIITRISGFGQDGPYSHLPCFDAVAQSLSGLMDMTGIPGEPPVMMGAYVCDLSAALNGVIGTLAALYSRTLTGRGQVVDVALLDSACGLTHSAILNYYLLGQVTTRNGNQDRAAWPASFYQTGDGRTIYIHAGQDPAFAAFARISGNDSLLEDPEYAMLSGRSRHIAECDRLVADFAAKYTMDELLSILESANIPCAPVNSVREMVQNPQLIHRKMIREIDHPRFGKIKSPGSVIKMSATNPDVFSAAPSLGEHNHLVYGGYLGYSDEEIELLAAQGVI